MKTGLNEKEDSDSDSSITEKEILDIYDTGINELTDHPVNSRYKEFRVSKPNKQQSYVSYEVTGYFYNEKGEETAFV
jgi:hypothetical protein